MTGLTRDRYHRYTWNGDGPLVGVTTPLKLQDVLIPGDLAAWGGRIAAEWVRDHAYAAGPEGVVDGALKAVSAARDIGTEVHAQIEKILLGQPATPTERTAPYVYAFTQFLAEHRPEFIGTEQRIVNMKYRFAGTFDFGARLPLLRNLLTLVDVKTGKPKASHKLQLAGYSLGEFIGEEGNPEPLPMPRFRAFAVLHLRPDGYELVQHEVNGADRAHFIYLVNAYHRIRGWAES